MPSASSIWKEYRFEDQNEIRLQLDALRLRIVRQGNDLLLVERRDLSAAEQEALNLEKDSEFRRYAFENRVDALHLLPKTPDRPIVVRPQRPLILAPNAKVEFYVSFPADLCLEAISGEQRTQLIRLRSEILSDTWFGDQMAGVLCYSLKSRARRQRPEVVCETNARVIGKIRIYNESAEQLDCEKFCLRLSHCHLWQSEGELWTSPIAIRFHGAEHLSAIDYSEKPPPELKNAHQIMKAEEPPLGGLIRRTFAMAGFANTPS